eukprot:Tbor_TRINITY_DN5935_c3_g4::TRINITY_DN5935_c3_g4_i1::g.19229::m.19229
MYSTHSAASAASRRASTKGDVSNTDNTHQQFGNTVPGSISALRVSYPLRDRAFPPTTSSRIAEVRRQVTAIGSGPRLGELPSWRGATVPEGGGLPARPMMHRCAAYQGVRLEYNYRAAVLPPLRELVYVPKASKMEVDGGLFLTQSERSRRTDKCLGTAARISRVEFENNKYGSEWAASDPLGDTIGPHLVSALFTNTVSSTGSGVCVTDNRDTIREVCGDPSEAYTAMPAADDTYHSGLYSNSRTSARDPKGWNSSIALAADRASLTIPKSYTDYRPINKKKEKRILLSSTKNNNNTKQRAVSAMPAPPTAPRPSVTATDNWSRLKSILIPSIRSQRQSVVSLGIEKDTPSSETVVITEELKAAKAKAAREAQLWRDVYVSPIQRQRIISQAIRDSKRAHRRAQEISVLQRHQTLAQCGKVYKISNRDTWWDSSVSDQYRPISRYIYGETVDSSSDED